MLPPALVIVGIALLAALVGFGLVADMAFGTPIIPFVVVRVLAILNTDLRLSNLT